jgi:ABC-type Fe3+ transport system permease subunit
MFILFVLSMGYLNAAWSGMVNHTNVPILLRESIRTVGFTLFIGMAVGGAIAIALLAIIFALPCRFLETFLTGYLSPSTALCGFAILSITVTYDVPQSLGALAVFALIFLPTIFRLGTSGKMFELRQQLAVAELLGAGRIMIYRRIVMPQIRGVVVASSAIGAVWSAGDYGVSRMFFTGDATLGLAIQSLASAYRVDLAGALSLVLLAVSGIIYGIFMGLSNVLDRKS